MQRLLDGLALALHRLYGPSLSLCRRLQVPFRSFLWKSASEIHTPFFDSHRPLSRTLSIRVSALQEVEFVERKPVNTGWWSRSCNPVRHLYPTFLCKKCAQLSTQLSLRLRASVHRQLCPDPRKSKPVNIGGGWTYQLLGTFSSDILRPSQLVWPDSADSSHLVEMSW